MNDTIAVLIVVGLAIAFFGLWTFNNKQKRKFEEEQRARKREIAELKAKAAKKTPSD